jgi:serine/threonine protein kinase
MATDTQVGGRFLGSGSYGCTFIPPLLCKGEKRSQQNEGLVSKIQPKTTDITSEIEIAKVLRTIPLSTNYFLYSIDNEPCTPAPELEQRTSDGKLRADLFECDKLQSKGTLSYFNMYRMPYGGKGIRSREARFNYWRLGKHLLEGLSLLLVRGIVHNDLHSGNVVIDDAQVPRIFDWGLANLGPNASKEDLMTILSQPFAVRYRQQPPELHLFIRAYEHGSIDDAMERIITGRQTTASWIQEILGVDREMILEQFETFRRRTLYLEKQLDFAAWWKTHWPKIDSWGLGVILLRLAYDLNKRLVPLFEKPFYVDKKDKIINALRGMCNFNCFDRMNAVQALAAWDSPNNPIIVKYGRKWL